jgi:hypothetical protein
MTAEERKAFAVAYNQTKKQPETVTLTLTREQAEFLLNIFTSLLYYGKSKILTKLKKQIKEKSRL